MTTPMTCVTGPCAANRGRLEGPLPLKLFFSPNNLRIIATSLGKNPQAVFCPEWVLR